MKNWEDDDDDEYCSSKQDLIDAISVAEKIGIDIEVVNFAKDYKEKVFSLFINGLKMALLLIQIFYVILRSNSTLFLNMQSLWVQIK